MTQLLDRIRSLREYAVCVGTNQSIVPMRVTRITAKHHGYLAISYPTSESSFCNSIELRHSDFARIEVAFGYLIGVRDFRAQNV